MLFHCTRIRQGRGLRDVASAGGIHRGDVQNAVILRSAVHYLSASSFTAFTVCCFPHSVIFPSLLLLNNTTRVLFLLFSRDNKEFAKVAQSVCV